MASPERGERLVEKWVTYTVDLDGRVVTVENVPARVDEETGERYFSPATVERLQEIMWGERTEEREVETAAFDFTG
jgi:YgiT-type zinc finger domain-containing protein